MQAQFWLDKWERQESGFHLQTIHPLLQKFYSQVFLPDSGVFVPLCGKTIDLTFFSGKGSYTLGCELSRKATVAFFNENKLQPEISVNQSFDSFISGNIELLVGDYFNLKSSQLKLCQNIYDRAALIALPEDMRLDYATHMQELFKHTNMMLITLEYPQMEMQGPPFSVNESEVRKLFGSASFEKVYSKNILDKEPKFKQRGLSYLNESVYSIHW